MMKSWGDLEEGAEVEDAGGQRVGDEGLGLQKRLCEDLGDRVGIGADEVSAV